MRGRELETCRKGFQIAALQQRQPPVHYRCAIVAYHTAHVLSEKEFRLFLREVCQLVTNELGKKGLAGQKNRMVSILTAWRDAGSLSPSLAPLYYLSCTLPPRGSQFHVKYG